VLPRFYQRVPDGSAADVRAKGKYDKKTMTVEFSRAINTGHNDDESLVDSFFIKLIRCEGVDNNTF
jgi:hypothetical protein